ncbi:helicase associated domain-containing protein [Streptomyces sp. NPDC058794]|uniref:helicase associated domain-containing protein n=1 Tax=Streptomyces sp. NPDC058794 TaxID=3346636 RepID=UPI0036ABC40B
MTSTFHQEHPDAALARTPVPPKLVDITHPWNRAPPKPIDKRRRYCSIEPNYEAARQFYVREGHLRVPRKHIERLVIGGDGDGGTGEAQEVRELRLGAWIGNQRSRAATLTPERMEKLSAIGMRWS